MLAKIVGIFPVPGAGLIWDSGTIEFGFDPQWSDGNARSINPVRGILHPTLKNKFVAPSSLGDLFVPATPTGEGVTPGPPVVMRWELFSSSGQRSRGEVSFQTLLANASNEWNVNQPAVAPNFVTSAGPDPVGLTVAAGDARYPLRNDIIASAQIGSHAAKHLRGGADAIPRVGDVDGIPLPTAPTLVYTYGATGTLTLLSTEIHTETDAVNYKMAYYFTPDTTSALSGYQITGIPIGWDLHHHANISWSQSSGITTAAACGTQGAYVQIPNPDLLQKILVVTARMVKQ